MPQSRDRTPAFKLAIVWLGILLLGDDEGGLGQIQARLARFDQLLKPLTR